MPERLAAAINDLSTEVHDLKEEVQGEREDRRAEQRRERRRLIIMFASGILVTITALGSLALWNRHTIITDRNRNNARFCAVAQVQSESDRNVIDPPGTAGRKAADAWSKLYMDLGCDDG